MKKRYVVAVPGLEAETTTVCPSKKVAEKVKKVFVKWLDEHEDAWDKPVIYGPGDQLPEAVSNNLPEQS